MIYPNKKPYLSSFFILLLAVSCFSCASSKVVQFLNEDMDFSKYETYRLVDSKLSEHEYSVQGALFFERIEKEIHFNMDRRLYTQAQAADLVVEYEIVSSDRTKPSTSDFYYRYYFNPATTIKTIHHIEGILIIEFRDRAKKKLVWQASMDLKYIKSSEPSEIVAEAVNEIFSAYPFVAGSEKRQFEKK